MAVVPHMVLYFLAGDGTHPHLPGPGTHVQIKAAEEAFPDVPAVCWHLAQGAKLLWHKVQLPLPR